jgi:sodium/hydrogen antiporter
LSVDPYEVALGVVGIAALLAAWVPSFTDRRPLSLPMVLVVVGVVAFLLPLGLPSPDPRPHVDAVERITELVVIVSLMGTGLRIDRPFRWSTWTTTWRLLAFTMPISIALVAAGGWAIVGLGGASAVLLGAVLAPTDPVLASDVQVGEPTLDEEPTPHAEDEVRFALTSEAGLNDALAFPFVYLALVLDEAWDGTDIARWFAWDLLGRIAIGVLVGLVIGRTLGRIAFRPPAPFTPLGDTPQGFVVIAATLLSYAGAEVVSGYGFLAVFVAAIGLRSAEPRHELHARLHDFADQTENLMIAALLVVFGGALVSGVLDVFTWRVAAIAVFVIVVVRPLSGWLALSGSACSPVERATIACFGIRGFGSVYYLAYALGEARFDDADALWAVVAATMLGSIVVHGALATPAMRLVDRLGTRRGR